jgi:predicted GNAT superfamily acetyltransferase
VKGWRAVEISIRSFKTWQEYLDAEELQRIVWQMPDLRDVVPANMLITAHKNGGILIGAFAPGNRLIGFVFSFIGIDEIASQSNLKHCSHMLAVLPEFQGQKIGERLKFAQREIALTQNIPLITWTYDPLLALNANLNLARLGAIARQYIVNAYGEMTDALNAGLPSDRFQVEWWTDAPRVRAVVAAPPPRRNWDTVTRAGVPHYFDVEWNNQGFPRVARVNAPHDDNLLVEIPADINAIKTSDRALALDWRMQTRDAFQKLFAVGYVAVDVILRREAPARAAYWLIRQPREFGIAL